MNPKTRNPENRSTSHFVRHPAEHLLRHRAAAGQNQALTTALPSALQRLSALQVTQMIEYEKAMFASTMCMNSCVMDIYKHLFWLPIGFGNVFEAGNQAVASCLDLEMLWLGGGVPKVIASGSHEPTEEEMDGLDIAVEAFDNEILA